MSARIVPRQDMDLYGPGGSSMDRDTDLFVQAFWVKCRDVIRPVLDLVIEQGAAGVTMEAVAARAATRTAR